ncbi:hypothetical protein WR25_08054 [Diploscapter pachys]|uniref:Uncharacterized protein n=1 Tax=Diploscapter pachys TaxID=2018661 RepID=A0A2A2K0B5_9BILA|nr:hypothetical protein WR25_08054 [Diploscapter pachys]
MAVEEQVFTIFEAEHGERGEAIARVAEPEQDGVGALHRAKFGGDGDAAHLGVAEGRSPLGTDGEIAGCRPCTKKASLLWREKAGRPVGELEGEAGARRVARILLGHEIDVAVRAKVAAAIFAQDVDPFGKDRDVRRDRIADRAVELAIGVDVDRVGARCGQEPLAPIVGRTCVDAVFVEEQHGIGTVRQTQHRKLRNARGLGVVVLLIAVDDRVVEDRAKAGVPEIVLDREFEAIDRGGLAAVERRRDDEIHQRIIRLRDDRAVDHRARIVGTDVIADVGEGQILATRGKSCDRRLITGAVIRRGDARDRRVDLGRADVVRHVLVEVADRDVAVAGVIPFRRQIDVLRLVGHEVGVADRTGAATDAEQLVDPATALQAAVIRTGDRMAIRCTQLDVLQRLEVEVDRGQPVLVTALERREAAALEQHVEFVLRILPRADRRGHERRRGNVGMFVPQPGDQALAVATADLVRLVEQLDDARQVEAVERLDDVRIVRAADPGELIGDAGQLEQIVGQQCRRRGALRRAVAAGAAPGIVLQDAVGRAYRVVGIFGAPVQAVHEAVAVVVMAAHHDLVDLVAEIGIAERVAGGNDIGRIQRIDARIHVVRDHGQFVIEVQRLVLDAEDGGADRVAVAVRAVRLRFGSRVMRIERHRHATRCVPRQVAAERLVFVAHRGLRRRIGQILGFARAKALGVKDRAGDRAVGPRTQRVVVVVPDADAIIANVDRVACVGVIDRCGQIVGRAELQHRLAVDALAPAVDDVVAAVLRHLIHVGGLGPVGDVGVARVARHRQRPPVVLVAQIAVAPADVGGVRTEVAALVGAVDQDPDPVVGERIGNDARDFGRDVLAAVLRGVDDAACRDRSAQAGLVERAGGADVDRRADAAGRNAGATGLVDLQRGHAFGRERGEVERARARRAVAVADERRRHLATVEGDEVIVGAEATDGDELAFAVRPVDRHAGDPLQRFGEVRVGELAHVLGADRVDDTLGVALDVDRVAKRRADAGDDDVAVRLARGAIGGGGLGIGLRRAGLADGGGGILRRGGSRQHQGGGRNADSEVRKQASMDAAHGNPPQ